MKKSAIFLLGTTILLTGCQAANASIQNGNDPLMTIGDTTYTKKDEYELLKQSNGPTMTMELIRQGIYDQVVKKDDAIVEEAKKQYEDLKVSYPDLEDQITSMGYASIDEYIDKVLVPGVQGEKMISHYLKDNAKSIKKTYKPSIVKVIPCENRENAQNALNALKDGTEFDKVYSQYVVESTSIQNENMLITTESTNVPTKMIKAAYTSKKDGVIDDIFTMDDPATSTKLYFVTQVVTNHYDDLQSELKESFSTNANVSNEAFVYYLKKFNFEIHDQSVFDYIRQNNPEYLIQYPELAKNDEENS